MGRFVSRKVRKYGRFRIWLLFSVVLLFVVLALDLVMCDDFVRVTFDNSFGNIDDNNYESNYYYQNVYGIRFNDLVSIRTIYLDKNNSYIVSSCEKNVIKIKVIKKDDTYNQDYIKLIK